MGKITSHMKKQIELLTKTFKNPQAVASLYHWLETELAYTSNHIEGNTLPAKRLRWLLVKVLPKGKNP